MKQKEADFRKRLLSTFKVEAHEHLKTISSGLIDLEKRPPAEMQAQIVETLFRATHSLKGAARAVNIPDIETVCHSLEAVFSLLKKGSIALSPEIFDTLYRTNDIFLILLSSLEEGHAPPEKGHISGVIQELSWIERGELRNRVAEDSGRPLMISPSPQHLAAPAPDIGMETVRVSAAKLSSLLLEAEEMLSSKLMAGYLSSNLRDITSMMNLLKKECAKGYLETRGTIFQIGKEERRGKGRPIKGKGQGAKLHEFFEWSQTHIKSIEGSLAGLTESTRQFNRSLGKMVDNLLDDMKKITMLPFSVLLEGFPLLVRNISHEQGKDIDLVVHGEVMEIDRRILEEVKDPLIHLIRNCVDHGIERPEIREATNKPRQGIIKIDISQTNGGKVEIVVSDDGTGIDTAKVKETAVKNGILPKAEADGLSDQELLYLIFHSGFSTNPIITDISGRGIGLAIAREKVERLGGIISIDTGINTGTAFRIVLPLTIATFRGVLVRAADQLFILPTLNVERVLRVRNDEIKTVENRETVELNGRAVSFVRLNSVLELPLKKGRGEGGSRFTTVLVLSVAEKRIAFGVEEMLNEQEVIVKTLGNQLTRVRNIAGAALLGSGKAVPILNIHDLLKSAVKAAVSAGADAVSEGEVTEETKSILIVEDSITSRMLLKNILESAGYNVKTAVDGIDAITALKTQDFDLVVSDVEMPRMDGFDLTAKIRSDKKLAELPVVLVTVLERKEDREKGIEVGANAYIVKSSFNQSNLLEVVRRLI